MLRALTMVLCVLLPAAAPAQPSSETDALFEALGLPQIFEVMQAEGAAYGDEIEDQMFPGRGGPAWEALVAQVYDPVRMGDVMRRALADGLNRDQAANLFDFFSSARGQRIVELEVSARRAFLDEAVEEVAKARAAEMRAAGDPRLALIARFVEVNDLVESNVMGAMNASFAFYVGLMDSGAFGQSLSESDILSDVWAQEATIREDSESWVYGYLSMAYGPLPDSDIEAYIALSETEAGGALNAAIFAGFDTAFVEISRALGASAARFMVGEDI